MTVGEDSGQYRKRKKALFLSNNRSHTKEKQYIINSYFFAKLVNPGL